MMMMMKKGQEDVDGIVMTAATVTDPGPEEEKTTTS